MPNTKTTFLPIDKFYMIRKTQSDVYHDVKCLLFLTFSTHSSCIFHACFLFSLKWSCMIFLLSASGLSLSNELSSMLLKVSHLVARINVPVIWIFLLTTSCGVQAGGHLLKRVLLTVFRSHLSKFLSTVGSIFQIFCPLEVQFFKFTSVLSQVCFISLL